MSGQGSVSLVGPYVNVCVIDGESVPNHCLFLLLYRFVVRVTFPIVQSISDPGIIVVFVK